MRILPVQNNFNKIPLSQQHKLQNPARNSNIVSIPVGTLNSENIKANFLPSFSGYRKIDDIVLKDKESGKLVSAELKRDKYGDDLFSYKIFVKGKEVGYMDLNCESLFPEDEFVVPEADNIFPEIQHLRSLSGDKYSGIGTALVKAAIDESIKRGKNGSVWLTSEQGYASSFSNYRKNENPIPFYYKLGFKAINPKSDKYIQECLEKSRYNMLPESELLILTSDVVKAKANEFSETLKLISSFRN